MFATGKERAQLTFHALGGTKHFNLSTGTFVKLQLVLWLLFLSWPGLVGAAGQSLPEPSTLTNALGALHPHLGYIGEYELTPQVSADVPNAASYYNSAFRLFLRLRERVILRASASATYGGRIVAVYDVRALEATNAATMTEMKQQLAWENGRPLLKAQYFRGRVFYAARDSLTNDWITVFASDDRKRIMFVQDSGPIYLSANSGLSWHAVDCPGTNEFTLSTTAKGSALVAVVSLAVPLPASAAGKAQTTAEKNWYCAASAADGSQLVLTGGPSQSAPVLSITRAGTRITVAWPAAFADFTLQQTSSLLPSNWTDVTNKVEVFDTHNQVIFENPPGRAFFRLRGR